MKRHTTTIALAAILIPSVCFAWGRDGHRIIGLIATKHLTPQALLQEKMGRTWRSNAGFLVRMAAWF